MNNHAMSQDDEKEELRTADAIAVAPEAVDDDPPPNGGYGWVVCFVCLFPLCHLEKLTEASQ